MTLWSATCEARYTVRVPFQKWLFGIVITDWETGSVCKCVMTRLYLHNLFFKAWIYEPPHNKTNKMSVCPVKTQISLGIRPVWSVFAVCLMGSYKGPKLSSCGQRRLWSDWADAQADLSLRWVHSLCWFCHVAAHICRKKTFFMIIIHSYHRQRLDIAQSVTKLHHQNRRIKTFHIQHHITFLYPCMS